MITMIDIRRLITCAVTISRGLRSEHVRTAPYAYSGPAMSNFASPAVDANCRGMPVGCRRHWQGDIRRPAAVHSEER